MTGTLPYPAAPRRPEQRKYGSVEVTDDYTWLEEDSTESLKFQRAQNELTEAHLAAVPARKTVTRIVEGFGTAEDAAVPAHAAGRWFRTSTPPGEDLAVLTVADTAEGPGRVLLDLNRLSPDEPAAFDLFQPSPDGTKLLYCWSGGGREMEHFQVTDVDSGELLIDGVPQLRPGFAAWLPDSSGFYYGAVAPDDPAMGLRTYFHPLDGPAPEHAVDLALPHPYSWPDVSPDGKAALIYSDHLCPHPTFYRDLTGDQGWQPLALPDDVRVQGTVRGDRLIAITDDGAPRRRLVAIPLATAGDKQTWRELIPETEAVLDSVVAIGTHLVLTDISSTYSRLRVLDDDGSVLREIQLPDKGIVNTVPYSLSMSAIFPSVSLGAENELLFLFSTLTSAPALCRADVTTGRTELLGSPAVRVDATVTDAVVASTGGAQVPYHVVRPNGVADGPRPTLIFGYGGFDASQLAGWAGDRFAAWIEAGGTLVLAHLRGGGELGSEWWQDGRLSKKQHSFDDVYAIAEQLIADGVTTADQLAVHGMSNGGAMAATVAVQRPDLFRATVPEVPITDLLALRRDPLTLGIAMFDYGNPDEPEDSRWLAAWSPVHNVTDGVAYPAVLLRAGANDPRCPSWHCRKLGARLQAATSSGHPVLIQVQADSGHGTAGKRSAREADIDVLTFLAGELGLEPR